MYLCYNKSHVKGIYMVKKLTSITSNIKERNTLNLNVDAFEGFGLKINYKDFFEFVDIYSKAYMEIGIHAGDIVTLCLAGTLDTIINFYALNQIGAISNFVNPNYFKINSKKYINDTHSKLLIIMDRFYGPLKESISQTNIKNIMVSSLTEYSNLFYKLIIRQKKLSSLDKIPNVNYISLDDFIKLGENSHTALNDLNNTNNRDATIVYTSGSTGNPKGVVLTNDSFNKMIEIYDEKNGFGAKTGDRNLILIPPMYGTSLCHCINTPLAFGCTNILQPIYNPLTFEKDIMKTHANIVVGSKAHYISLLNSKAKENSLSFLNLAFTGGEPITASLASRINEKLNFLGVPNIIIGYGMSELGTMAMFNMDIPNRVNQSGHLLSSSLSAKIVNPLTGNEVKPNEKGDLLISSPCAMKEYYNNPDATSNFFTLIDGKKWAKTGDIATIDENGCYNVLGRKSDSLTNKDGNIIYLFDIENLIESISYVKECEVVPITLNGSKYPIVHIILNDNATSQAEDIVKYIDMICQRDLSPIERPYAYKIRKSFSTSPISGKRDYETLKYETKDFIMIQNGELCLVDLNSDECNKKNEIEEVKKLNLKI